MSSILIIGITVLILLIAYIGYGKWLAGYLGVNFRGVTPAVEQEDNQDYVVAKSAVLEAHQGGSLAGPTLFQGVIASAMFGWVPVVCWLIVGGLFLGAFQNMTSLFTSVRNKGKSMGTVIQDKLGQRSGKGFMIMAWFAVVVFMAFFMDVALQMLPGVLSGGEGVVQNGYHASVSMALLLLIPVSIMIGYLNRMGCPVSISTLLAFILMGASCGASIYAPIYLEEKLWWGILLVCALAAAILPTWLLTQSMGYLSCILMAVLMVAAIAGIVLARPELQLEGFTGWKVDGEYLFPYLFVMLAMVVFSGYHNMVSSGISSRQVAGEKQIRKVGYGPIVFQILAGIVVLVVVGIGLNGEAMTQATSPVDVFYASMWSLFQMAGAGDQWKILAEIAILFVIAAMTLSGLNTASQVGRVLLQEIGICRNKILSAFITVIGAGAVAYVGYNHFWPVAVEYFVLMIIPVCISCMVWLKEIGRPYRVLFAPVIAAVIISLGGGIWFLVDDFQVLMSRGFQQDTIPELLRILLIVLGMIIAYLAIVDGRRASMKRQKIVFATGNAGKIREIKEIMGDYPADIMSMKDAGIDMEIDENGATFEENAIIKARAVAQRAGCLVLADDSGLEIDYLDKEPGVHSARYMGEETPYSLKNAKILERLEGVDEKERTARFVCAIAAVFPNGETITTRGTMEGIIGLEAQGENGFGYDPIFYPEGYDCSSAELSPQEKNEISHRGKALRAMKEKLV